MVHVSGRGSFLGVGISPDPYSLRAALDSGDSVSALGHGRGRGDGDGADRHSIASHRSATETQLVDRQLLPGGDCGGIAGAGAAKSETVPDGERGSSDGRI